MQISNKRCGSDSPSTLGEQKCEEDDHKLDCHFPTRGSPLITETGARGPRRVLLPLLRSSTSTVGVYPSIPDLNFLIRPRTFFCASCAAAQQRSLRPPTPPTPPTRSNLLLAGGLPPGEHPAINQGDESSRWGGKREEWESNRRDPAAPPSSLLQSACVGNRLVG